MPNLSRSSAAIRSSPQVTLLAHMSAISFCRSAGIRGRPRALDFHLQNSRKPFRCQRIKVSGLTTVRASRHANNLESNTRVNLADAFARRGLTLRSRYKANCLRRKRFSAAKAHRGRRLCLMKLRVSSKRSNMVSSTLDRKSSFGIKERIAYPGPCRHFRVWIGASGIITDDNGGVAIVYDSSAGKRPVSQNSTI